PLGARGGGRARALPDQRRGVGAGPPVRAGDPDLGPGGRRRRPGGGLPGADGGRLVKMAPLLPLLARQTRAEFLKLWRVPANSVTSLALPIVFYVFIALGHTQQR